MHAETANVRTTHTFMYVCTRRRYCSVVVGYCQGHFYRSSSSLLYQFYEISICVFTEFFQKVYELINLVCIRTYLRLSFKIWLMNTNS